jgi:uncharacterized protein YbjT (DUF2867 family)
MFLLSAVAAEELTGTLTALTVAREAGLKGLVYLSVYKAEEFADVPHQAAKHAAERMIVQRSMPVTVLRPAYFMQNDERLKDIIMGAGVYPQPVGSKGVSMVDIRDIVEVSARELIRRAAADGPLPWEAYDLVGPDVLTQTDIAAIWSEVLGKTIKATGDVEQMFQMMRAHAPSWLALDLRQMLLRFAEDGAAATQEGLHHLAERLGRPPRGYREFAVETAEQWTA